MSKPLTIREQIKATQEILKGLQTKIVKKTIGKLNFQVGDKGTVNIFGINRMPVCLYPSQIVKLTDLLNNPEFKQFVVDNMAELEANAARNKAEKEAAQA